MPLRPVATALHDIHDRRTERLAAASFVAASRRVQRIDDRDLADDRGPMPVLFRDAASCEGSKAGIMASVARDIVDPSLGFRRSIPMSRRGIIAAEFAAIQRASVAALAYAQAALAMRADPIDAGWTDVHLWLPSPCAPIDVVVTRGHGFGMTRVLTIPPTIAALVFAEPPPVAWSVTMESGILILDRLHMRHRRIGIPDPVSAMRAFAAAGIGPVPLELVRVGCSDLDAATSGRIERLLETTDA